MRGTNSRASGIGILMVVFGGAGLAEISTSNHGSFIICATVFAVGFALCLRGFFE